MGKKLDIYRGAIFSLLPQQQLQRGIAPRILWIEDGALVVEQTTGTIARVVPWQEFCRSEWGGEDRSPPAGTHVHDLRGQVILPGFVDTHVHLPQLHEVAGRSQQPLLTWLERYTFPAEKRFADRNWAAAASRDFFAQLLRVGTTTAVVMGSIYEAATDLGFQAAKACGGRIYLGKVMMDRQNSHGYFETTDESLASSRRLAEKWHGENAGLLQYLFAPRFALSCTANLLKACGKMAREMGIGIHTHINEDRAEKQATKSLFRKAKNYADVYRQAGFFGDFPTVLAHQIHVTQAELNLLKPYASRICTAHCPVSNFALRAGAMDFRLWRLYQQGRFKIGLGSDVGASPNLSLFDVMRHAHYLSDNDLHLYQLFYLATVGGAEALGLPDVGSLVAGYQADFVVIDPEIVNRAHGARSLQGLDDILLVLVGSSNDATPIVSRTFVRGREVFCRPEFREARLSRP